MIDSKFTKELRDILAATSKQLTETQRALESCCETNKILVERLKVAEAAIIYANIVFKGLSERVYSFNNITVVGDEGVEIMQDALNTIRGNQ